jgi:uncharacterized protein YraI
MKMKILASVLSISFLLLAVSGCGMKLPETSDNPSGEPAASGSSASAGHDVSTIIGIVSDADDASIKLDMVKPADTADTADKILVGGSEYVKTGGTLSVDVASEPAVILEGEGYDAGDLRDILAGDFLAVALKGDTVIAIVDSGPAQSASSGPDSDTDSEPNTTGTGGTDAVQPDVSPQTSPEESPETTGVPNSSEKAAYTVTTDDLNVRNGPGTTYSAVGKLAKGTTVTGTVKDGWLKLSYNGLAAYCKAEFLAAADTSDTSTPKLGVPDSDKAATYVVGTDDLNMRSGPATSEKSLGRLDKGAILSGTVKDGWLKFTWNKQTAYCKAEYLMPG